MSILHSDALATQYADASLPPNVLVCERSILGAVLWHGLYVAHPLRTEDFYAEPHRRLFQLITELYASRPHIEHHDPIAVLDEMYRRGRIAEATDMYLMYSDAIARCTGVTASRYHVERILETAEARTMQAYGQRIAQVGDSPERATALIGEMQTAAADFRARIDGSDDVLAETALAERVRLNRLAAATSTPAMSTGLIDLDRALNGGLRPSTFNVMGARPGVGKSLLAGAIAVHLGSTHRARVLYVTMELSAGEVANRMLSNIGGVELTRLQNPHLLDDNDLCALDDAQDRLSDWPIHIVEGSKTIEQIEADGRAYLSSAPAGLMIVDFLGRIREDGTAGNRERHVAMCASRLTDLSRELRVPVLCIVSFSRDSARRGTAPRMDDIRDSGNVESDADTVMLLWQPDTDDPNRVEIVIDKNRYGLVTNVDVTRQGSRGRMVSRTQARWTP